MTVAELNNEFNLLYDNISSGSAPGLDSYEKSVYLTTAQLEIVRSKYAGINNQRKGFEGNEQRRRELSELVKTFKTNSFVESANKLYPQSKFVTLPADLMYILHETIEITNRFGNKVLAEVIPIEHDKIDSNIKNPFRKPNEKRVFRLDVSKNAALKNAELVPGTPIDNYTVRYLKYPSPIILANFELDPDTSGLGLKIQGLNVETECVLDESIQKDVLNRAVELAIRDFRENSLQSKIQTNNRLV